MNEPKHVRIVQYICNPLEPELKDQCEKAYIEEISNKNKSEQESD